MSPEFSGRRAGLGALVVAVFALAYATPAFAQYGEYPFIEISMGYGNLGFPKADGTTGRHSGFASQQNIHLKRWFGLDNYVGYYSMGNSASTFSNVIGAKLAPLGTRSWSPYAVGGVGWSRITAQPFGLSDTMLTTRLGGGLDIPLSPVTRLRTDISRMWFHTGDIGTGSNWTSGMNYSGGIVFILQ